MNLENSETLSITTRYRGSKAKILPLIWDSVKYFDFFSVLDCFGGTGAVSYMFKKKGKFVVYNDHLKFNHIVGRALIENSHTKLTDEDILQILQERNYSNHPHIIEKNFHDIYYTKKENIWLDRVISNIYEIGDKYKRDLAFWSLFQACITKRPFSLFHRKNLDIRTRDVKRTFGNKTTWETSFDDHFRKFTKEINNYVFDSGISCFSINCDAMALNSNNLNKIQSDYHSNSGSGNKFDLVYIDPPYIPQKGENIIYRDLYHFLEGITFYNDWDQFIDIKSKHKRLIPKYNIWNDKKNVSGAFSSLIGNFKDSIIVISHRSDGLPSQKELISQLRRFKDHVEITGSIEHKYALSHKNSREIIILAY